MSIKILPEDVAIKIAAGEVVERPLSVVKELIENSIDANATAIKIRVLKGGKQLIEVADDGVGMSAEDMALVVQRHATSKIRDLDDLEHISSLGFRGEALASIAAVSQFTIQSHTAEESTGHLHQIEAGRLVSSKEIGGDAGTIVRVENLFFNTPARLKFLKQELTEKRAILGLVHRYAFAYPHVQFNLMMDEKIALQTSGKGNQRQVLSSMFGLEDAKQMMAVDFSDNDYQVLGFTSPVGYTRSNRKDITFFLNGRWIIDPALASALIQAYHTYLMVGRFPFSVLTIKIPPEDVDVNVHPAKAEVRFKNPGFIFSLVQRAIRHSLLRSSPPVLNLSNPWIGARPENSTDYAWVMAKDPSETNLPIPESFSPTGDNPVLQNTAGMDNIPLLRSVGQIGAAYLVAEGPDGLYLIDQHAAHERILFEKFNKLNRSERPRQQLLNPLTIHLSPPDFLLLAPELGILNQLGFDIEEFGLNTVRVKSIPAMFSHSDPLSLIRSCIEDFEENELPLETDLEQKVIARICKRSAVKSGQILSQQEQSQLILELEHCHSPRTCPHGRPTMIHLSVDLLERQFGRRGSR